MKHIIYFVSLIAILFFCGCSGCKSKRHSPSSPIIIDRILPDLPVVDCQTEVKFSGKPHAYIQEFWSTDSKKYELSGGRDNSYSGDGIQDNSFSPKNLSAGEHYIYYRDCNDYRQPKRIKIKIISLISEPVECVCDDDYRIKCTNCNEKGEIAKQIECLKCKGSGKIRTCFFITKKDCDSCQDGIATVSEKCPDCKGKKWKDCDKH